MAEITCGFQEVKLNCFRQKILDKGKKLLDSYHVSGVQEAKFDNFSEIRGTVLRETPGAVSARKHENTYSPVVKTETRRLAGETQEWHTAGCTLLGSCCLETGFTDPEARTLLLDPFKDFALPPYIIFDGHWEGSGGAHHSLYGNEEDADGKKEGRERRASQSCTWYLNERSAGSPPQSPDNNNTP